MPAAFLQSSAEHSGVILAVPRPTRVARRERRLVDRVRGAPRRRALPGGAHLLHALLPVPAPRRHRGRRHRTRTRDLRPGIIDQSNITTFKNYLPKRKFD